MGNGDYLVFEENYYEVLIVHIDYRRQSNCPSVITLSRSNDSVMKIAFKLLS